ncbi:hypothetical protein ACYSNM_08165 [Myroides sp. LJL116]
MKQSIQKIWDNYKNNPNIPADLIENGFSNFKQNPSSPILILGTSTLFKSLESNKDSVGDKELHLDTKIKQVLSQNKSLLLLDPQLQIDLRDKAIYRNILFFTHTPSPLAINQLTDTVDGRLFLMDQLELSGKIIENIKPRLIILTDLFTAMFMGFFGEDADFCWLGLFFQKVETTKSGHIVYKINGHAPDVFSPLSQRVNLDGVYVIYYPKIYGSDTQSDKDFLKAWEIEAYTHL